MALFVHNIPCTSAEQYGALQSFFSQIQGDFNAGTVAEALIALKATYVPRTPSFCDKISTLSYLTGSIWAFLALDHLGCCFFGKLPFLCPRPPCPLSLPIST